MKCVTILLLIGVITYSVSAEKLIFEDNFDKLDLKKWEHELTLAGGGNWEFQWYVNNRTNSFIKDGVLHLQPSMTEDAIGTEAFLHGDVNIWGGSPADSCTNNAFYGCERNAAGSGQVINPIRSARLRTVKSFGFTYGRVEVRAKMPKGDWLWPAIWMLPTDQDFGGWPASGEVDILESRGNDGSYPAGGNNAFGSTLHWGPDYNNNRYEMTHADYKHTASLGDDFHTYGLYWSENRLYTYFDTPDHIILDVDFTKQSNWDKGNFNPKSSNPWVGESNNAPFNKEFHLIFNLAVGGTNAYFPDNMGGKPWSNSAGASVNDFWNARGTWQKTWNGEDSSLRIDSVKVWSFDP